MKSSVQDLAIVMQLTERIKVLIAIKVRAIKREIFILDKNVKSRKMPCSHFSLPYKAF